MPTEVRLTFVRAEKFDADRYVDLVLRLVEDLRQRGEIDQLPDDAPPALIDALTAAWKAGGRTKASSDTEASA